MKTWESYVYWTVHHLDSWIKIDQLDITCFIISLFTPQHVSNVNASIFSNLRLIVDLFHVLYCSVGEEIGVYRVLVGKQEGKRPLGRSRRRWGDNIRMDLQEVGCGYMDWIGLAQDRDRWRVLVSAVMNLRVPWNAGNFLTSCEPVSCSRRTLHYGVSK